LEIDLENSLVGNLDQLEKGLKLYRDDSRTGQQFVAKGAGIIDLLANDSSGDLVVIELKAGEADKKVCGQIQAYMGWVKKNLAGQRRVRGIIVANEFTEKLALASGVVPDLALKKYTIVFKFSNPE
jgi:RecB family endonuclease NucS